MEQQPYYLEILPNVETTGVIEHIYMETKNMTTSEDISPYAQSINLNAAGRISKMIVYNLNPNTTILHYTL